MRVATEKYQTRTTRQRGASLVEYTLLLGIVATVGIGAMRTIGGAMAGSSDPCNPGLFVKVAMILGEPSADQLTCQPQ
jgi:hypothetical protein